MKPNKDQSGFTLIEVMLVVVILGILASIALPRLVTSEHTTKVNACDIETAQLRKQIERYHFDHNSYPETLADLVNNPEYFPNGGSVECPVCNQSYEGAGGLDLYDKDNGILATCPHG